MKTLLLSKFGKLILKGSWKVIVFLALAVYFLAYFCLKVFYLVMKFLLALALGAGMEHARRGPVG